MFNLDLKIGFSINND